MKKNCASPTYKEVLHKICQEFSGWIEVDKFQELIPIGSSVEEYVQMVNEFSIQNTEAKTHFEIRCGTCESYCKKFYCVVQVDAKGDIKEPFLGGSLKEKLFREIMNAALMNHPTFYILRSECRKIGLKINPVEFPEQSIELCIDNMLQHGYLVQWGLKTQESNEDVGLGMRTLIEFSKTLRSLYGASCKDCIKCKNITLYGAKCEKCEESFHLGCSEIDPDEGTVTCPSCNDISSIPVVHRFIWS